MVKGTAADLFSILVVGPFELKHRVVMAPLTRIRALRVPAHSVNGD
jgi:N-ethylmaleimide reductase